MASATCFPAFKKKQIGDDNYIDGGYYDNLPISLAIEMGAEEIIAIDLRTFGFKRHVKDKNIKITYIAPRNDLGSFLVFHQDLARRGIKLGYNDTMKTFDRLDGNIFTFKHNHLLRNFKRYGNSFKQTLDNFLQKKNDIMAQLLKVTAYKKKIQVTDINKIVESLGKIFKLDDSYINDINKFNKMLICKFDEIPTVDKKLVEAKIKNNDLKNLVNSKYVIKYIYDKLVIDNDPKTNKELSGIALLLPHGLLEAIYLYVLKIK